jgi:uncharacterized protein (DUF1778 family)
MARPPSDNPASASIRLRVTPDDKEQIRKRAADAGVTMSEYLLRCALGKAKP